MNRRAKQLSQILLELAEGKSELELEKLAEQFYVFLKEKNSLYLAPAVIKFLEQNIQKQKLNSGVTIISAYELKENVKRVIEEKFPAQSDFTNYQINPKLIGGFVIKHAGLVYDFSLKTQINSLKKCLSS